MKIDKYMQNAKGDIVSELVEKDGYLIGVINKFDDSTEYIGMWTRDGRRLNGEPDLLPLEVEHPLAKYNIG